MASSEHAMAEAKAKAARHFRALRYAIAFVLPVVAWYIGEASGHVSAITVQCREWINNSPR